MKSQMEITEAQKILLENFALKEEIKTLRAKIKRLETDLKVGLGRLNVEPAQRRRWRRRVD